MCFGPGAGEPGPSSQVPLETIARWGHVLDIVTPHCQVTNCFTKTYTRFAKVCLATHTGLVWLAATRRGISLASLHILAFVFESVAACAFQGRLGIIC